MPSEPYSAATLITPAASDRWGVTQASDLANKAISVSTLFAAFQALGLLPAVAFNTYTPTFTGVANVTATTALTWAWLRVGNLVILGGGVSIDPTTGSTLTKVGISLPITSNFTAEADAFGADNHDTGAAHVPGRIIADVTNDRLSLEFYCEASAANRAHFPLAGYIVK